MLGNHGLFRQGGTKKIITLRNNRVAIFGDSITLQSSNTKGGTQNIGYLCHALRGAKQRFVFDLADNYGVGGETSAQIRLRVQSVINSGVGLCILLAGTNDRSSGGGTITDSDTINNLKGMRDTLISAGIYVIIMTPMPRGDSAYPEKSLSGTQLDYHVKVHDRCLTELPKKGCLVVDNWPTLLDTASTTKGIILGYTRDGLHPGTIGAYYTGLPLIAALNNVVFLISAPDIILPVVTNAYNATTNPNGDATTNPLFTGTATASAMGTNGSGVLGSDWTAANGTTTTDVTRVYSKVTTSTGDWQQCVVGGAAASAVGAIDIARQTALQTKMVLGTKYEAVCEFEVDAGTTNIYSFQLGITVTAASGAIAIYESDRYDIDNPLPGVAFNGTMRTPRVVIPTDATDVRMRLIAFISTKGAPKGTFRFRKACTRRVL